MNISTLIKSLFLPLTLAVAFLGFSVATFAEADKMVSELPIEQVAIEQSVNINTADAGQISSMLTGIGVKKAQAIVEWREANGNFTHIEQLLEVKGIGAKILELNKPNISL